MPIFFKGGALQVDIEKDILELSEKTVAQAKQLADDTAPVITGAYRAGITTSAPDVKGWSITGTVGHSVVVEFRWGHRTLNNAVEKALTDNGVKLH